MRSELGEGIFLDGLERVCCAGFDFARNELEKMAVSFVAMLPTQWKRSDRTTTIRETPTRCRRGTS